MGAAPRRVSFGRRWSRIFADAFWDWQNDNAQRMAAALAFYTAFSLAPVIIIAVAVAGFLFGRDVALQQVYQQALMLVGPDGESAIRLLIENAPQQAPNSWGAILGIATMIFAATSAFAEFKDAMNTIWKVRPRPRLRPWDFVRDRALSFALVLVVGFLMVVSLIVNAVLEAVGALVFKFAPASRFLMSFSNEAASFLLIGMLFALMYKVLPDARIAWRHVWLGAATTTTLFVLGKRLFGVYLGHSSIGAGYGAAGSLIIVVLWTYYSAAILLYGAEVTQMHARYSGDEVEPSPNAVRTTRRLEV